MAFGTWLTAVIIVLALIAVAIAAGDGGWGVFVIVGLVCLPLFVSSWALGSQRCRDFGWTGWAMLLTLIPYVGWIFAVAIMFIPGTLGPNRYGPDPLGGRPDRDYVPG